jgi:hypothetical protein
MVVHNFVCGTKTNYQFNWMLVDGYNVRERLAQDRVDDGFDRLLGGQVRSRALLVAVAQNNLLGALIIMYR